MPKDDVLWRLRDLSPGYGNIIKDAVEEIERLRVIAERSAAEVTAALRAPEASDAPPAMTVSDDMIERAYHEHADTPEGHREMMRAALTAALEAGAVVPVGWRWKWNEADFWKHTDDTNLVPQSAPIIEPFYAAPVSADALERGGEAAQPAKHRTDAGTL